jgi:hypothetical protein
MSTDNENKLLESYSKLVNHFNKYISEKKLNVTLREFLENLDL